MKGTLGNHREPKGTEGNRREPKGSEGNRREPKGTEKPKEIGKKLRGNKGNIRES